MSSQGPSSPPRESTKSPILKPADTNMSFNTQSNRHSFIADPRDPNSENVQSFVIVNDIDIEEELTKAQNSKNSAFQTLSMSFYGKIYPQNIEPKENNKMSIISHNKSLASQKRSPQTSPDSKRTSLRTTSPKSKPEEAPKRSLPNTKNLVIIPEQPKRRAGSPKVETTMKVYSPLMAGKRPETGNFTAKALPKREPAKSPSNIRQKSPPGQKVDTQSRGNKMAVILTGKAAASGRSCSPRGDQKKPLLPVLKAGKTVQISLEPTEEKVQKLNISPSSLEIKPEHVDEEHIYHVEQESELQDFELNESRAMSQGSSWKESALKGINPSGSEKSLISMPESQTKIADEPTALDQYNRQQGPGDTPKGKNPQLEAHLEDNYEENKYKHHANVVDLQDSDTEDESFRRESIVEKASIVKSNDKSFNSRNERQRSPGTGAPYGRGPGNGIMGNKGVVKKDITPLRANQGVQGVKKSPQPRRDGKEDNLMRVLNTSKMGDKKKESRQMSPTLMEVRRHFDLIDKLILQKSVKGKV